MYVNQSQDGDAFILPIAVDIYAGGKKERHKVWLRNKADTLTFKVASKPSLVNVDGDKALPAQKTDRKSLPEFAFQYANAPLYLDRFEAIDAAKTSQADADAQKIIIAALKDKYYGLRIKAIEAADMSNDKMRNAAQPVITMLARTDENTLVRAAALKVLGKLKASAMLPLYRESLKSQSYAIQGAALSALSELEPAEALKNAKTFEADNKAALTAALINVYSKHGGSAEWPFVYSRYKETTPNARFQSMASFGGMAARVDNPAYTQQGITVIKEFGIQYKQFGVAPTVIGYLDQIKAKRAEMKDEASVKAADEAIKAINDAK